MKMGTLVVSGALVVLALVLAACGSDDSGDRGGEAATSFNVEGMEFGFVADSWRVAANQDVTITFNNVGPLEHDWSVLSSTISSDGEFAEDLVIFNVARVSGGSSTGTFNLPPGTYQVICTIPGHFAAGMEGTLHVVEG
jgi:plastocyanin